MASITRTMTVCKEAREKIVTVVLKTNKGQREQLYNLVEERAKQMLDRLPTLDTPMTPKAVTMLFHMCYIEACNQILKEMQEQKECCEEDYECVRELVEQQRFEDNDTKCKASDCITAAALNQIESQKQKKE